jgi:hypothetical protein
MDNFDRRGRGGSGKTLPYAVEREIEDLDTLIAEAGMTRFPIVNPRSLLRAIAGRAEQAPMLMAAAKVPVGFERTMMPRTTVDQGLITGLAMVVDYAPGALVQDAIEVAALRLLDGRRGTSPTACAGAD